VEHWGQGPWFELDRDDDTDTADGASGADVAAQKAPATEATSRPRATPPDALADAMEPRGGDIADGVGGVNSTPANIFDMGADVVVPEADVAEFPSRPPAHVTRPPRPSAPYYPTTAPSHAVSPSTRTTGQPVLTPPPDYTYDDFVRRSTGNTPSISLPRDEPASTPSRDRRTLRRALLAALLILLLALGVGYVALSRSLRLPAPPLGSVATQFASSQPSVTATTGAPIANTAAVVAFTAANQRLTFTNDVTSCPSGCDITGQTYSANQTFSKQASASQIPQTALSGTIHVVNTGSTEWGPFSYSFSGGGYTCNPRNVDVQAGLDAYYSCFIGVSSPSTLPAGTIANPAVAPGVSYSQPAALMGNGFYQVTSADCQAALNDTKTNQGVAWAASWQSGQSIPSGWQWAKSAPSTAFSNDSCPSGQQQPTAFTFTASSLTTASNSAYNPAAAQSFAKSRLNGQLPSGYAWRSGDPGACTVAVKSSGGSTVTLTCPAAGTAVYVWTDALKADFAAKLLGKSKDDALAACNSAPGIQPSSCVITLRDNATILPDAAKDVTIQVKQP
jgi:hypothetical protein